MWIGRRRKGNFANIVTLRIDKVGYILGQEIPKYSSTGNTKTYKEGKYQEAKCRDSTASKTLTDSDVAIK